MAKILTSIDIGESEVFDIIMPNHHNFFANDVLVHNCDIDVDSGNRDRLLKHLEDKYGDGFAHISTDTLLRLKSAIKDAERYTFGAVRPETEKFTKTLPTPPQGVSDHDWVFGYTDTDGLYHQGIFDNNETLRKYAKDNPEIWNYVSQMLGIIRNKSAHSCGIVLAEEPIQNYCPITYIQDTKITGYSPKALESSGLLKFDILGLNTLYDIQQCLKSINDRLGIKIDPWNLPEDPEIFKQFALANTTTVFQFDTDTVRPYLRDIKPKSLENLANVTSLVRPGTLDSLSEDGRTLAEVYVARVNGEPIRYIHNDLQPIMQNTYGVQLFQEQTLRIFRDIGGFTYEEAEKIRRAIGKKDELLLREMTNTLKEKCLIKGWNQSQVDLLVQQIMASAKYSFNKSHACSYSYVAYACMYLKTYYPLDWWKAIMSNADKNEIANKFWPHVYGFTVFPDINKSGDSYLIDNDKLVMPISIINGVGAKAYEQLVKFKPYKDFRHFVECNLAKGTVKSRSAVDAGMVRELIIAGVLDSLFDQTITPTIEDKLALFEQYKAEVKQEAVEPVPAKFIGITPLGRYLAKKQLINVYSEDLRPLILYPRGGRQIEGDVWVTQDGIYILNGTDLLNFRDNDIKSYKSEISMGCIAYVIEEKIIQYQNKTKQATKITVDVNGIFFEDVLWPVWKTNIAPSGFKGLPVLMIYKHRYNNGFYSKLGLKQIIPYINADDKKIYTQV